MTTGRSKVPSISRDNDFPKLHEAVRRGDLSRVKQLTRKGDDINQLDGEKRTALHLACAEGKDDIVKFLLANNAKTNLCDNYGQTPLMEAVLECHSKECIKILLEHGAQPNVTDSSNSTSLHFAAANGDIDTAALLLERKAKVNAKDKTGFTPLHTSSQFGNLDFVNFLINKGANIDDVNAHDRTALMVAASEGHIDIVRLFLQHNANTELEDSQGWKAADHAGIHGHDSVLRIIKEYVEQQERARNQAKDTKSNQATSSRRGDWKMEADEGGYNSSSSEDSGSIPKSPSLESSGDEDDDIFESETEDESIKRGTEKQIGRKPSFRHKHSAEFVDTLNEILEDEFDEDPEQTTIKVPVGLSRVTDQ